MVSVDYWEWSQYGQPAGSRPFIRCCIWEAFFSVDAQKPPGCGPKITQDERGYESVLSESIPNLEIALLSFWSRSESVFPPNRIAPSMVTCANLCRSRILSHEVILESQPLTVGTTPPMRLMIARSERLQLYAPISLSSGLDPTYVYDKGKDCGIVRPLNVISSLNAFHVSLCVQNSD